MLKTPLDVVVLVRPIVLIIDVKRDFNPGLNLDCDHHNLCFNLMSTDAISIIMQCTFLLIYIEYFICMYVLYDFPFYIFIYIPASKSIMIFLSAIISCIFYNTLAYL